MTRRSTARLARLLTLREIEAETGLPYSTAYDAVVSGELPALRIGRAIRVRQADFEQWLDRCRVPASNLVPINRRRAR